jgi:MFS family permease
MSGNPDNRQAWQIVAMLFLFMLINFLDKTVIGLAAVPIMDELHLTHLQFGTITASFFYLFSLSAVLVGFISNRFPAKWALFGMSLVWGVSQLPMFGGVGFGTMIASRMALGAGEGPAYPVAVHATHKWFPNERRALPAAIIGQGANVGVILVLPLLNWVLIHYSWHVAFGALGVLGLAWGAIWLFVGREGTNDTAPETAASAIQGRVPYVRLIFNRTTLGAWAAGFGAYWALSLLFSWFTPYLIQGLGFSQAQAGLLSTLPWAASVVFTVFGAGLSQRMIVRGVSSRYSRGVLSGAFVALGGLALIAMPFVPTALKLPLLVMGLALPSLIYSLGTAIAGEIAPPAQRGAQLSIGSAVSTSAGLIAPALMGGFIDTHANAAQGYETGFAINGVIALVGGLIAMALINPARTKEGLRAYAIQPAE